MKKSLLLVLLMAMSTIINAQKNYKSKHDLVHYVKPPLVDVRFSRILYWVVNETESHSKGYPIKRKYVSGQPSGSYNNPYASVGVLGNVQGFKKPIDYYKIERKRMPDTVSNILVNIGVASIESKKEIEKSTAPGSEIINYSYDFEIHVPIEFSIITKKWVTVNGNTKIVKTKDSLLFYKDARDKKIVHKFNFPGDFNGTYIKSKSELKTYFEKYKNPFLAKVKMKIFNNFLVFTKREFVSKFLSVKEVLPCDYILLIKDKENIYTEVNALNTEFSILLNIIENNSKNKNRLNWYTPEASEIIKNMLEKFTNLINVKDKRYSTDNIYGLKRNRIVMLFFDSQFDESIKEIDEILREQEEAYSNMINNDFSKKERKIYKKKYKFLKYQIKLSDLRVFIVDYQIRHDAFKVKYGWG